MITYDRIMKILLENMGQWISYEVTPDQLSKLCDALDDLYDEAWKTAKSEGFADGLNAR